MWYWNNEIPQSIREAIQNSGPPLLLTDSAVEKHGVRPVDIKRWCRQNLKTFVWMHEQDVSDNSLQWDYIYAFYIKDEKDRNWFHLRWGGINA